MQLHVKENLWNYQRVCYDGVIYNLTRLGFGLASAPRIMTKVLERVLSLEEKIRSGTSIYVDDILVDGSVVSVEVVEHLKCLGLKCKETSDFIGSKLLGLQIYEKDGTVMWTRGRTVPEIVGRLTKKGVFSLCGQLISHYPIAGWLRVSANFIKRKCNRYRWQESVSEDIRTMLEDTIQRVRNDDPVNGVWYVPRSKKIGKVWCDASKIAIGCVLEIAGNIVEDGCWLRREVESAYINVAALEAVVRGINLALKWGVRELDIVTDSASVFGWLSGVLHREKKIKVTGMNEMLVRRRLTTIVEILESYNVKWKPIWTPSELNRADALTRVRSSWLDRSHREIVMMANDRKLTVGLRLSQRLSIERLYSLLEEFVQSF